MNRGIFSLASGMVATQQAMDLVANNLANVNTGGFKADKALFNDALERAVSNPDGTQIGTLGSGATVKEQYTDQTQGAIRDTGNPMDFSIQGKGMFATMNASGQISYTRDGSFARSANGELVTAQGDQVLDSSLKPIQLRPGPIVVSPDGGIASETDGDSYAKLGIFSGTFSKGGSGRYISTDAAGTTGQIKQGSVEGSNVNPITTMVDMISLGRNFDMAQKSMQAEDDMTQRLTSTLS